MWEIVKDVQFDPNDLPPTFKYILEEEIMDVRRKIALSLVVDGMELEQVAKHVKISVREVIYLMKKYIIIIDGDKSQNV